MAWACVRVGYVSSCVPFACVLSLLHARVSQKEPVSSHKTGGRAELYTLETYNKFTYYCQA